MRNEVTVGRTEHADPLLHAQAEQSSACRGGQAAGDNSEVWAAEERKRDGPPSIALHAVLAADGTLQCCGASLSCGLAVSAGQHRTAIAILHSPSTLSQHPCSCQRLPLGGEVCAVLRETGWAAQSVLICPLQELKLLEEDANVYKLVGPVLVKQDLVEAKANVNKRLEFIRGEIERVEQQLTKLQDKQSKRQQQVGASLSLAACWEQANCRTSTAERQQQVQTVLTPLVSWEHDQLQDKQVKRRPQVRQFLCRTCSAVSTDALVCEEHPSAGEAGQAATAGRCNVCLPVSLVHSSAA